MSAARFRASILVFAALLWAGLVGTAAAERRVALIVANADYGGASLENPIVDSDLVRPALQGMGFDVEVVKDADLEAFVLALQRFYADAKGADIALFYFAGHGFALNGGLGAQNYLMSTSADVTSNLDQIIRAGGVGLDEIIASVSDMAKTSLIFVDACRNNPSVTRGGGRGRGLARLPDIGTDSMFVGLSTRLGDTAEDGEEGAGSPFARAFAEIMPTPGLRLDDAFRRLRVRVMEETSGAQRPEARDDLNRPLVVVNSDPTGQPPAAPQPSTTKDKPETPRVDKPHGPLPVETVKIERPGSDYAINVAYPKTGLAEIDRELADWAKAQVESFAGIERMEGVASYSLDIDFEIPRNDGEMFAVGFEVSSYSGGAHGNQEFVTFNFVMPDGWRVFLPEMFDGERALERISALTVEDLRSRLMGPDSMTDEDWIGNGAGPSWSNFANFILDDDTLVIRFPPYQVAAYAAGAQKVSIPLSKLSNLMRAEWRTPVPSFDCAKAGTAPERAICSDIALARLDRALTGAYSRRLNVSIGDDASAIKKAQRAWLKGRNGCGGDVSCLSSAYDERLKVLETW